MTREQAVIFVVFPVVGYLLGSVPFAWVIGKMNGVDIRKVGSKNIGSTNLGRTLGARFFWYAFVLDAAKGFVPVLAAALYVARHNAEYLTAPAHEDSAFAALANYLAHYGRLPSWSPLVTGAACFLGHLFPVFLKFKGGKGVATSFGVVLGFWPLYTLAGIIAGAFFVFMLMVYRYISLASMSAAVAFVGLVAFFGSWNNRYVDTYLSMGDRMPLIEAAGLFAAAIVYRHRANIGRLIKGTEPRIGQREVEKAKMGEQGGKGEPK